MFSSTAEETCEGNNDLFYQNSIRKYEDDSKHLVIYILYYLELFSNLMALQFCEQYLSYSMISILFSLLSNHDNLVLNLHQEKIAALMKAFL